MENCAQQIFFFFIKSRFRSTSNYKWLLGKSYKTMEYIKVSRVIVRVRNSLVARCPWQAEIILAASLRGRCPQKILQGCEQHGQVENVNFIPWFIVFTIPCAISERFIIYCWHVALWRGGTGGALVCALRPRAALVLLFWPCTGGHCGWGCRGGASLFLKVCDNDGDVAHSYCQLLCSAPVHVFQPGPWSVIRFTGLCCGICWLYTVCFTRWIFQNIRLWFCFLVGIFLGNTRTNFLIFLWFLFILLFNFLLLLLFRGWWSGVLLGHLLCHQLRIDPRFSGGGAFPHIADAAFKGFGAVSEGADATIPKAFVCGRFCLSFWPG